MIKRILLFVGLVLWSGQALAADNYSATAGTGLTFAAKSVGGILFPWSIPSDSTGAAFGVTGNPFFVTSTVLGTAANQSTINTSLGTINTTLGTPMQASGGSVTANQATAANLKSQVNIVSGGVASGAIASGAVASGAIASGAFASGSLASGSMVDLLTFQGSKAAGTAAANSLLAGLVYNSSPLTLTTTQQSALQGDANGYLKVNVAAGGSGGGAVYGPTANGSAAANPPVIIGGTATGGATGNVANAEVIAGSSAGKTDPAVVVADPNVLAAVQSPLPGVSVAQTSAAASSLAAKTSAGSVVSISGSAASGSYIMLFNATSAPSDGSVTPLKCWGPMAAAGPFSLAWGVGPVLTMSTGITVVSSSTGCFTKTATNAAFLSVEYQ